MSSRRVAIICLAGYVVALGVWKLYVPQTDWLWRAFATLRFAGVNWLTLSEFLLQCAARTLPYALLGALCVPVVGLMRGGDSQPAKSNSAWRGMTNACLALALALLLVGLLRGIAGGALWYAPGLLIGTGCVLGVSVGDVLLQRGFGMLRALLLRVGWLLAIASVCVELLGYAVLSGTPSISLPAVVTSAEKRVIIAQLRDHNPLQLPEHRTTFIALPIDQMRAMLAWAALLVDPNARVEVGTRDGALVWQAALHTPRLLGREPILNIGGELSGWIASNQIEVNHCAWRLGNVRVTGWLCRASVRAALRAAHDDRTFGSMLATLRTLQIDDQGVRANYGRVVLDEQMHLVIQRLIGPGPAVRAAVEAQVALLRKNGARVALLRTKMAREQFGEGDTFGLLLRSAFDLARQRSAHGDAAAENQGAILALAQVLGHHRVGSLAGLPQVSDADQIIGMWGVPTLRNRPDWVKHFLVSAGLTQISTVLVSDAAGLLKEEMDAGGGSGFSFGDLQADRAGTAFGEVATRDDASARTVQDRIVDRYRVADFMPEGADLPENMQDAAFTKRFGGVGGERYRAMVALIEARVRTCALYRE